jgi:prophage antirepressor-like protein
MDPDEMSFLSQPCKELDKFDIFRPEILDGIKDLYNPLFKSIRIFGTVSDPIFIAKDVQDTLGLKDMNYSRDGLWEWEKEKVKIKIQTSGGAQQVIGLTEQGLYKSIFHSKVEMALKFQTFMTCVMKRLRTTGSVTMEQAIDDFHAKIAWLEAKDKALNMQMEIEHRELVRLRILDERREIIMCDQSVELYKAQERLRNSRDGNIEELRSRLNRTMARTGRPIYIMLSDPPKEHKETHTYELEEHSEWDSDFMDSSEVYIFSIGLTALKTKVSMKKVYVHKSVKLEDIHQALMRYRLERIDRKGDPAGYYTNMYEISLDQLDTVIDGINLADERTHLEE